MRDFILERENIVNASYSHAFRQGWVYMRRQYYQHQYLPLLVCQQHRSCSCVLVYTFGSDSFDVYQTIHLLWSLSFSWIRLNKHSANWCYGHFVTSILIFTCYKSVCCTHTRNTAIAGTESIDCIGKSLSCLGEAIPSSNKNDVLIILTSQMLKRCMVSPHIGPRELQTNPIR